MQDDEARAAAFLMTFQGNPNDHAQQNDDGTYTRMGRGITRADVQRHMRGLVTIAPYLVRPRYNDCGFVVFDIDDGNPATVAAICDALNTHGIGPDSRTVHYSGHKGWHVTLLLARWTPATVVRQVGRLILDTAGNPKRVELFPKQDTLPDGKLGNVVKLPEGLHRVTRRWCHYEQGSPTWETVKRIDREHIEQLAATYQPAATPVERFHPPAAARPAWATARGPVVPAIRKGPRAFPGTLTQRSTLPPCMRTVLEHGVPDGMRHSTIFGLALTLYSKGVPEQTALTLAREANSRNRPPLPDSDVQTQVAGAYSRRYRGLTCQNSYLHDGPVTLCEERCRFYRPAFGKAIPRTAA